MSKQAWIHKNCGGEMELIERPSPPITPPPETICRCTKCHAAFADHPRNVTDLVDYMELITEPDDKAD